MNSQVRQTQTLLIENSTVSQVQTSKQSILYEINQIEENDVFVSSNLISFVEKLTFHYNNIIQRNLLESLDQIKRRQCVVLKCEIFTKTIDYFLKRKAKKTLASACEALLNYRGEGLTQSLYSGEQIKQSLETSLGTESVFASFTYQKPLIVLCQNCKTQVVIQSKTAKPFVMSFEQNMCNEFKVPEIVEAGKFANDQRVPLKLATLVPDQVFSSVNDQSTSFINIEIASNEKNYNLSTKSLSTKISKPIQQQTLSSFHSPEPIRSTSSFFTQPAYRQSQQIPIEKSFIEKLSIQQSHHQPATQFTSHYASLLQIPCIEQSQIIYNNQDSQEQLMKALQIKRRPDNSNIRIMSPTPQYNSRFSDSEIKKHISEYRSRSTRPPEKVEVYVKKQRQEIVGSPRGQKPTFFETAFYFN